VIDLMLLISNKNIHKKFTAKSDPKQNNTLDYTLKAIINHCLYVLPIVMWFVIWNL
jgi:hypothetical protein